MNYYYAIKMAVEMPVTQILIPAATLRVHCTILTYPLNLALLNIVLVIARFWSRSNSTIR
jgi:hypothetical protein